jgi:outer membrane protein
MVHTVKISLIVLLLAVITQARGQSDKAPWTLTQCINYALDKNIGVQQNVLSNETNKVNVEKAKAHRLPSLSASASQNYSWSKSADQNNNYGSYKSSGSSNYSLNSSVKLYNGFSTTNSIKQANLNFQAGQYNIEEEKETVSLNVLDAYLQVLYSEESVKNAISDVEATTQQLALYEERLRLGAISKSDYLQVKSELASENLTLANNRSTLAINRISLMQLMEYPLSDSFQIVHPEFEIPTNITVSSADSIFMVALGIKPQIKYAELNKQISELDVVIARAGYLPVLTASGSLSTNYASTMGLDYGSQVSNKLTPSVGLTLSVPIFQNKDVSSSVAIAKIGTQTAALNELSTRNELRKSIEQSCSNVESGIIRYNASLESFNSNQESYNISLEKFNQGLVNSVELLIQKNNLITAQSELLQSKYNLVFNKKILDFYAGISLTL